MSSAKPTAAAELVPIADRLRYMQVFRLLIAVSVLGLAAVAGRDLQDVTIVQAALATGAYVALSLLTHATFKVSRRGGLWAFGLMLMVDGVYLAAGSYVTGGAGSPVRYLIVLHLIAVALLASYRTGMKLALWHSLLLLVVFYMQKGHVLRPFDADRAALGIGTPFQQLIAFSCVFWAAAIGTSSFSAVNERDLRRRRYDLEALAATATRIEEAADPAAVADALLDGVLEAFDFERVVLVGSPGEQPLALLGARGDVAAGTEALPPGERSVLTEAMRSRRTQLVSGLDPAADPWLAALLPKAANLVVAPMWTEGHPIGAVVAQHSLRRGSRIERRVVGMVERYASYGSLALRNAWLHDELQRMAVTDPLTGVANRMRFQDELGRELARATREGHAVSLAMVDVDHFKRVNDTRGHQAGDRVLREVAAKLVATCRPYDLVARYGGEEFAVILPGSAGADAAMAAERLRSAVERSGSGVTASVGLATFPSDGDSANALVGAADTALYDSKRSGRNRVTVAAG